MRPMNQDQGKRRATRAQAFVLLIATFCLLLLPRGAWAEDQPPPAEPETRELPPSSPKLAPKQPATETPSEREPEATPEASPEPPDPPSRPKLQLQKPKVSQAPSAVTVKSLPTGENKTGVSAQSISVPKGPGTIEGMGESFSAQASTGIATFSVPFALPAARGDAQPSLGLSYSSASGSRGRRLEGTVPRRCRQARASGCCRSPKSV
jgi:cytoskeletal protein RodZ